MPFVRIQLMEGRTPEQKEEIANFIIDKMVEVDFAKREGIRVIYEDMKPENFHKGQKKD